MAVTPGFLGIDEPAVIDKRADTNVVTRAATVVHREVVSIGSADDATPESIAKVDSTGSLRTVSTDAAGTNQQAITAAGDAKITLDGETVAIAGTVPVSGPLTDAQLRASAVPISAASLPLPAGAATAAAQLPNSHDVTVDNASGAAAVNIQDGGNSITVDGTVTANIVPVTSGGLTTFHLVSAGTTNATNLKASAGQVYGWYIYNSNLLARKVAFHNTAGTPTAGTSVFFSLVLPPGAAANVELTNGIAFSTGIAITTVTGLADADAVAVAVNDLIINIWYK